MPRKIKQYTNPFLKSKDPLLAPGSSVLPNLQSAIALHQQGQLDQAEAIYRQLLEVEPRNADALNLLGVIAYQTGHHQRAVEMIGRAIEINPYFASYHSNRGIALKELKQLQAAVVSYDKAISLKPGYAEAYSNRGNALQEMKQFQAAVASYDKAIELRPDFAETFSNRGAAMQELGQFGAAVACYDRAFELNPTVAYLLGNRLHSKMLMCDWTSLPSSLLACEAGVVNHKSVVKPFIALTLFDKPELHLLSSKTYVESKYLQNKSLGEISKRNEGGKVRIGYFSADLHYHPVAIWLAEQLENHDKSMFELFAFSFQSDKQDPMKARLEAAFDHFIEVDKMSDLEVAQRSRQLGIDIALDLTGFTVGCRAGIFAARAAPIQVSHLGFPGTMGAEFIDYVISDAHSIPEASKEYFTEKIAYVPCGYTYDRQRQVSDEPLSREQFGLPETGFVFTCQNRCQKFMPEVFGIWMDILKAVPGSVLWLLEPPASAVANLIKEAGARGVQSNRLVFTKRETVADGQEKDRIERYLAIYRLADLFLDTWPYNAGTTAVDALWAGLPVLTKAGKAAAARMATSALHAIEIPELITQTPQEYLDLAVQLASVPQKLKRIKDRVQENRLTSALFDPVGNTRHIEAAYTMMHERYRAGLAPEHLYVAGIDPGNNKSLISV